MSQITTVVSDHDLNASIDGQLEPHRAAEVAIALDGDPKTRARVDLWKRQNDALRSMFASIVFEPVPLRLTPTNLAKAHPASEASSAAGRGPGPRPEPPRPPSKAAARSAAKPGISTLLAVAGLAFALGVAASYGAAGFDFLPRLGPALHWADDGPLAAGREIAKRAVEAHQTYATDLNRPVEILASDEVHLVKWIQHRLTMPIRIPDLHRQGWNLIGGRVVPGELGPAAFLVYGNGVERLGLYIARTNAPQADEFTTSGGNDAAGTVGYWIDEPFGYALTTSRGTNWMERNGPTLYESVKTQARDNASAF
jgi:anti-sigma factor RsiW